MIMTSPDIMIEVVQAYIFHRTGKEVAIRKTMSERDLFLLVQAYDIAVMWFRENGKIEFIK